MIRKINSLRAIVCTLKKRDVQKNGKITHSAINFCDPSIPLL